MKTRCSYFALLIGMTLSTALYAGPLHELIAGAEKNQVSRMRRAVDRGASVHRGVGKWGWRALHFAARYNNVAAGQALLDELGASINGTALAGWTAAHVAAFYGNVRFMEMLLRRNPNLDLQTGERRNVREVARLRGHQGIVDLIDGHVAAQERAEAEAAATRERAAALARAEERAAAARREREAQRARLAVPDWATGNSFALLLIGGSS